MKRHQDDKVLPVGQFREFESRLETAAMQDDQRGAVIAICDVIDEALITSLLRKIFKLDEV